MKRQMLLRKMRRNRPVLAIVSGILITLALTLTSVIALYSAGDGSTEVLQKNISLVAAVIALGGVLTTQMANTALAGERARADELQKYLEQMQKLLSEQNPKANFLTIARAQTLAVLKGLRRDPDRKRVLMLFLSESCLLNADEGDFSLKLADLSSADLGDLHERFLGERDLSEAHLEGANFSATSLSGTNLSGAHLKRADLSGADLSGADLSGADLSGADLRKAKNLTQKQIEQTIGRRTTQLPNYLQLPKSWKRSPDEQRKQLEKQHS